MRGNCHKYAHVPHNHRSCFSVEEQQYQSDWMLLRVDENKKPDVVPSKNMQVAVILADAKSKDPGLVLQILRELTKGSTGKDLSLDDLARLVWSIGPTGQVRRPYLACPC